MRNSVYPYRLVSANAEGNADIAFVVDDCDPASHPSAFFREGYVVTTVCVYWTLVLHQAFGKKTVALIESIHDGRLSPPIAGTLAGID